MKILHVIDSGGLYGAEVMMLNLMDEQRKQGLEPVLLSIGGTNEGEKEVESEARHRGHSFICFRMRPGPNLAGVVKVLSFSHHEKIDIIHSHGYKMNILLGFIPRFLRRFSLITTVHGWTSTRGFSKMKIYECVDFLSLNLIDAVVLVHHGMLSNSSSRRLKHLRCKVINNGIPSQQIENTEFENDIAEFCKKCFTIGSIGRLSEEKGYRYLINSIAHLIGEGLDIRLIIIGDGPERNELGRLVYKNGLEDYVMMPGYKKNARQYIPCFSLYAIPSLTEGLPITLLETMQARVPVVGTNVGGIPDVLDHGRGGVLVQPCDSMALAYALRRLYKDQDLATRLTEHSYHRFTKYFTSRTMAEKYLKVYHSIL